MLQHYNLTDIQTDIWLGQKINPDSIQFLIGGYIELKGDLKVDQFYEALKTTVNNEQVFQTQIREKNGKVEQYFLNDDLVNRSLKLTHQDKSDLPTSLEWMRKDLKIPLNFRLAEFYKFCLIRVNKECHYFYFKIHHIICDFYAINIFITKLLTNYNNQLDYKEFITSEKNKFSDHLDKRTLYKNSEEFLADEKFWAAKFSKITPVSDSQFEKGQNRIKEREMTQLSLDLPTEENDRIKIFLEKYNVSILHIVLALLYIFFSTLYNIKDLIITTPVHNRLNKNSKNTVGIFISIIPIILRCNDKDLLISFIKKIKNNFKENLSHSFYPVQRLLKQTEIIRKLGLPEIRVSYTKNKDLETLKGNRSNVSILPANVENVDLSIHIREYADKIKIEFDFFNDYFQSKEISKLKQFIQSHLASIDIYETQPIVDINLLSRQEEHLLKCTDETYPELIEGKTFLDLFKDQVYLNANKVAVISNAIEISYKDLDEKSSKFANYLISQGIKKGDHIPVCVERSENILIILLGIVKAGGVYIPIPSGNPINRTKFILSNLKTRMVILDQHNLYSFNFFSDLICLNINKSKKDIEKMSSIDPLVNQASEDLVYIIYTSGTTGTPKGVMVKHIGLLNLLLSLKGHFSFSGNKSIMAVIPFNFDMSCTELILPIVSGGKVIIANQNWLKDGFLLGEKLAFYKPDYLQATPSTYQLLVESGWQNKEGIELLTGGESISVKLKNKLLSFSTPKLWNLYGPTEITIFCSIKELKIDDNITLGRPLTNNHIFILNDSLKFLPIGIAGNIYISGIQLAKGYLNNKKLTSISFIDTFIHNKPVRLYKTGDLGKWNSIGEIIFLGRRDEQIKIRGHRIELMEIETILNLSPEVSYGVILLKKEKHTENQIIAFVTPVKTFQKDKIISYLKRFLPEYMIPIDIIEVNKFPVNTNGKIDKNKLLNNSESESSKILLPTNDIEFFLTETWKDLLKKDAIDLKKDFFELGGHSILVAIIISRILKKYDIKLSFKEVFNNSSIPKLSKIIKKRIDVTSSVKNRKFCVEKNKLSPKNTTYNSDDFITLLFHYLKFKQIKIKVNNEDQLIIPSESDIPSKIENYIRMNANEIRKQLINTIPKIKDKAKYHSSYLQNSVWRFLLTKGKFANMSFGVHLETGSDFELVQESFIKVVERHESLRTKFLFQKNTLFQRIESFKKEDLRIEYAEYKKTNRILASCAKALNYKFDLFDELPLIKGYYFKKTEESSYLFFVVNHLVFDGFSINIFIKDLFQYYETKSLPPLNFQFKEYVGYNNFYHIMGLDINDKEYWSNTFKSPYIFHPLAIQKKSKLGDTNFINTISDHITLGGDFHQLILNYCKNKKCTVSTFFLTLYIIFIRNNANTQDILLSTNVSNREEGELNEQIGLYTNSIFFRVTIPFEKVFSTTLKTVSETYLEALQKSKHYTSNQVFNDLGLDKKYGHELLRKFTFNHLYTETQDLSLSTINFSRFGLKKKKFGCYYMLLFINETNDQINFHIEGNKRFFDKNALTSLKKQLIKNILEVTSQP